ncbi:hypothetical protein OKW46_000499 [Paraburkholderia sp. WSM4179]|nr:hypothetical protein [Paraburkholderia sp. WSM4179]
MPPRDQPRRCFSDYRAQRDTWGQRDGRGCSDLVRCFSCVEKTSTINRPCVALYLPFCPPNNIVALRALCSNIDEPACRWRRRPSEWLYGACAHAACSSRWSLPGGTIKRFETRWLNWPSQTTPNIWSIADTTQLTGRANRPDSEMVLRLSEDFPEDSVSPVASVCRTKLEGIIGKRGDAPYRSKGRAGASH